MASRASSRTWNAKRTSAWPGAPFEGLFHRRKKGRYEPPHIFSLFLVLQIIVLMKLHRATSLAIVLEGLCSTP
jgi:hypothetical protein